MHMNMNRSIKFAIDGVNVKITYWLLIFFSLIFTIGVLIPCIYNNYSLLSSSSFSPVSFSHDGDAFFDILIENFITYSTYIFLGMLFSSSAFGFIIIPALLCLSGFSLSCSVGFMLVNGVFLKCIFICLPLWSAFIAIIILYYSICFLSSFSLFKNCMNFNKREDDFSLSNGIRIFYIVVCFTTVLSLMLTVVQYIFYHITH